VVLPYRLTPTRAYSPRAARQRGGDHPQPGLRRHPHRRAQPLHHNIRLDYAYDAGRHPPSGAGPLRPLVWSSRAPAVWPDRRAQSPRVMPPISTIEIARTSGRS